MLAGLLARRLAIPDVVVYLLVGILLGPEVGGAIDIKADSALNQIILIFGACYILFDGGASLRVAVLKQVWITIVIIATVGVVIPGAITAAAAYWILGIPLIVALLLGAAIASTDPATLVPVFRQVRIRERVAQTVMSESALNDATGAILTFGVLAVATGAEFSLAGSLIDLGKQAAIGLVIGGVLGYLAAVFIAHERLRRRRRPRHHRLHARRAPDHGVPLRGAGSACQVDFQRDALHVLDARDGRDPGSTGGTAPRHEGARRRGGGIRHLHRGADD